MSRFFRSADSSSSSSESEPDSDPEPTEELEVSAGDEPRSISGSGSTQRPDIIDRLASNRQADHRDFLLHALLEQRCTDEVLASYGGGRPLNQALRDSPEVQRLARARYQRLSSQLASLDLISSGLESDQHAIARQRYRDGLDILSQERSTAVVPPHLRRLLTDSALVRQPSADRAHAVERETARPPALPFPLRRLLTDVETPDQYWPGAHDEVALVNHPSILAARLPEPRYFREFEELSVLGRGGYGIVYQVKHRLDSQFYAVKKVPLSADRLQRIQERGHAELDQVLRELRTLARLDHPNIVRYYAGWIEWVDGINPQRAIHGEDRDHTVSGASDSAAFPRLQPVSSNSHENDLAGVFEESESDVQVSQNTKFSASTETAVSFSRGVDASASIVSSAERANFGASTLAIHMQMSLHPMTLAEFLSPPTDQSSEPGAPMPLAHCFHVGTSIAIVQAILDGLEYLHSEDIVHRDIKPGNIFLGRKDNPRSTGASVDLMLCSECRAAGHATPIKLEVRIGDFGLVSVADPEAPTAVGLEAVGTEMYRPVDGDRCATALDLYALGIVMFELCWKFDTRMERVHVIRKLKLGEFPPGFAERLGEKCGARMMECIAIMMADNDDPASIPQLREMLHVIQHSVT